MLALFRMELSGEEITFFDDRTEFFLAVFAGRRDYLGIYSGGIIGVDKVEVGFVIESFPEGRVGHLKIESIPTHVGNFDLFAGETFYGSMDKAKTGGSG